MLAPRTRITLRKSHNEMTFEGAPRSIGYAARGRRKPRSERVEQPTTHNEEPFFLRLPLEKRSMRSRRVTGQKTSVAVTRQSWSSVFFKHRPRVSSLRKLVFNDSSQAINFGRSSSPAGVQSSCGLVCERTGWPQDKRMRIQSITREITISLMRSVMPWSRCEATNCAT